MALIYNYFYGFKKKFLPARVVTIVGLIMMFLSSGDVFGDNDYALSKPTTWDGWFNEGNKAFWASQYDKAIECYQESIKLKPGYAAAYRSMAYIYSEKKGDYDNAIKCYKKSIKSDPKNATAHYNLGIIYAQNKKDYKKAVKCYKKAIKIRPTFTNAYYNMGRTYQDNKKNYKEVIKCFDKAIELDPNFAKPYHNKGKVYSLLGKQKEAVELHKIAARLGSEDAQQLLNDIGIAWQENEDSK